MCTRIGRRGFTLVELLIVLLVVFVLVVIIYPIFSLGHHGDARKITCTSNVKQIATAAVMYAQDNYRQFPGIDKTSWVAKLAPYIGGSENMFSCPSDESTITHGVSYAWSGLLLQPNGTGIFDKDIVSSSEVGVVADAAPTTVFPNGNVIGGCALNASVAAVQPTPRHHMGCVVGFADGHAKYFAGEVSPTDISNGSARALYSMSPLGLVDNPVGMMPDFTPTGDNPAKLVIGGDYALRPLLKAAADAWKVKAKAPYSSPGWNGQYTSAKPGSHYAWGVGDGTPPAGPHVAVGRDAVLVVVAKGSKIPALGALTSGCYLHTAAEINALFAAGYAAGSVQVYALDGNSGTRAFLLGKLGNTGKTPFGKDTTFYATDREVADAVANDPYGIGFISSTFFDPDRLVEVALKTPDGKLHCYPTADAKHRWDAAHRDPDHPFSRTLYVAFGGQTWTPGKPCFGSEMLAPGSPGMTALQAGPLFTWGYGKP